MTLAGIRIEWLLNPLSQCCIFASALVMMAASFAITAVKISRLSRRSRQSNDVLRKRMEAAEGAIERLRAVNEKPEQPVQFAPPELANRYAGLNLTMRAQALRMYQRGEAIPTVASALRVPQNEIELLIKLQKSVA